MRRMHPARAAATLCLFAALLQSTLPLHAATMAVDALRSALGVCSTPLDRDGPAGAAVVEASCNACALASPAMPSAPGAVLARADVPPRESPSGADVAARTPRDRGPPPATGPPAGA
ncbi:MAG: hypothetical protein ACK5TE_10730 [Pseudomonadota bacterium]